MDVALGGIYYFQTYYQNLLLIAVSLSMIGWMFYLHQQLHADPTDDETVHWKKPFVNLAGLIFFIILFIYGNFSL